MTKIMWFALVQVPLPTDPVYDSLDAVNIEHNAKKQTVTLTFPQELAKNNKGMLKLQFNGTLNDKMCGFYRSVFVDKQGNKK